MAQAEAPTYAGHFCQDPPVQSYFLPIEKVILKSRRETAATLLLLMPSGKIIISTDLLPESHYSKTKEDVWSMKCERHSSTIWRQPKACEEKLLRDNNFINAHEFLLNAFPKLLFSVHIIFFLDKKLSRLFQVCALPLFFSFFFCREPIKLAVPKIYRLQR